MQKNTIPRILEYYFKNPYFTKQIKRALREFFNGNIPEIPNDGFVDEFDQNAMFNEWIVFDFMLDHGKTLLEDFYDRNPINLLPKVLKVYKELQNNTYSFFEILKINKGKGLKLLDLYAGKEYSVREKKGTYQAKKGQLIFGRISKIGKDFELVGCSPITYGDAIRLGKNAREYFKNIKDKLNPKIIKDIILENQEEDEEPFKKFSLTQAKKDLNSILTHYKLKKFVSVNLIQKWINNIKWEKDDIIPVNIVTMLLGLSDGYMMQDINALMEIIGVVYNNTSQKCLKNKTPSELTQKRQAQNKNPEFIFNPMEINHDKWQKLRKQAQKLLQKGKYKKAEAKFQKCFEELYKQKTTNSQIYRIFANYAVNNLYDGNKKLGLKFLKISLALNPNYDFALMTLDNYKKGKYDEIMLISNLKRGVLNLNKKKRGRAPLFKTILSKNSAYIYYEYLKQFKINFKTKKLTKSKITKTKIKSIIDMIRRKN